MQKEFSKIAVLRWILKITGKEHTLRTNYHRSHPHFLAYLTADAVISVALIVGGFHYFSPQIWGSHERFMIEHPGIIAAPVDRFLNYMTSEEEGNIFWIGPISGHKYRVETENHKFHRISYFLSNAYSSPEDQPQFTVTTYVNSQTFMSDVRSLLGTQTEKRILSGGNTIEFASKSPRSGIITFPTRPEIVEIDFRVTQSKESVLVAAEKLEEIG